MTGIIVKNISNDYKVNCNGTYYICKPRGKFRLNSLTPLVGDIVTIDEKNNYILEIKKRKNELIRPCVANVDIAVIVTSVKQPNFDSNLLDKQLTIISYNNIIPIIYFTKLDLLNETERENMNQIISYYKNIGYLVSTNPVDLLKLIENKIVVLTGQSGAGKTTVCRVFEEKGFAIINADKIAEENGLKGKISAIMEVLIFKIGKIVDFEFAVGKIKENLAVKFQNKGGDLVNKNIKAIDEKLLKEKIKCLTLNLRRNAF